MSGDTGRWRALGLLSLAELLALSLWFSASAVLPALSREWALGDAGRAGLTIAVQAGFIVGTLAAALTNLPDVVPARSLMMWGALAGAAINAGLALGADHLGPALVLRFLTGVCLAGTYPPAMKIVATWFREGRGLAIGLLVAALTVGSATPHLIRGLTDLPWRHTLLAASVLAAAGALTVTLVTRRARIASRPPASTCAWPPRSSASAGPGWPASATSGTCGSSTRCGRGWAPSWPRASRAQAAASFAGAHVERADLRGVGVAGGARLPARRGAGRPLGPGHADDGGHGGQRPLRAAIGSPSSGPPLATSLARSCLGDDGVADSAQFSTAVTELARSRLRRAPRSRRRPAWASP